MGSNELSRRDFLRTTGAVATTVAAGSTHGAPTVPA